MSGPNPVWKHQIARWDRRSLWDQVVQVDGLPWYRKPAGESDLLAFRLGGASMNIAEVREAPASLRKAPGDVLVRLGQSYRRAELPIGDLDEAVAAELVFSLWVRRRDAHACNRVYVGGVPVFFDHHVAFGLFAEADRTLDGFLRDGPDRGYVTRWRVEPVGHRFVPTTDAMREWGRRAGLAIHAIRRPHRFGAALRSHAERIDELMRDGARVAELVDATIGGPAAAVASANLARFTDELPLAIERVEAFVYDGVAPVAVTA